MQIVHGGVQWESRAILTFQVIFNVFFYLTVAACFDGGGIF